MIKQHTLGYHLIIDSVHFLTEKIPGGYSLTFALDLHVSHHFREFLYFFIMTFSCFESTSFASGALLRPIELACECELLSLPLSRVSMARHAVFPICSCYDQIAQGAKSISVSLLTTLASDTEELPRFTPGALRKTDSKHGGIRDRSFATFCGSTKPINK